MSTKNLPFERTQSFRYMTRLLEEGRQPWRKRMLYFERRQSFVAGHVVLEKEGSHEAKAVNVREEERTSNSSLEFLEMYTPNVRTRSKSRKEPKRSFYTRRLGRAIALGVQRTSWNSMRCSITNFWWSRVV